MKKTFIIKNYKGNIIKSLNNFKDKYFNLRITEAIQDGDKLKISAVEDMGGQFNPSRPIYKKGRSAGEKPRYYITVDSTPRGSALYFVKLSTNQLGFDFVKASQQDNNHQSINVHPHTTVFPGEIHSLALKVVKALGTTKLKELNLSNAYVTIRKETAHMMSQSRKGDIAWSAGMPIAYYDGFNWNKDLTQLLGEPTGFENFKSLDQIKKKLIRFFSNCLTQLNSLLSHTKKDQMDELIKKQTVLKNAIEILKNNTVLDEKPDFPYWALRQFNAPKSLFNEIIEIHGKELNELFYMALD